MKEASSQQWECGGKQKCRDLSTAAALVLLCYTRVEEERKYHLLWSHLDNTNRLQTAIQVFIPPANRELPSFQHFWRTGSSLAEPSHTCHRSWRRVLPSVGAGSRHWRRKTWEKKETKQSWKQSSRTINKAHLPRCYTRSPTATVRDRFCWNQASPAALGDQHMRTAASCILFH